MVDDSSSSQSVDDVTSLAQNKASVPISVYQQLAEKLRETEAEITTLQQENQQLRIDNHTLYNQIHQVVQSTERLKDMINRHDFGIAPLPSVDLQQPPPQSSDSANVTTVGAPEPIRPLTTVPPERFDSDVTLEAGVNVWVLLVAAIAMILTAFGAGYMVVLPLLNNNNAPSR